ncbi:hypothetical protein GGR42_002755 [Saonia flava]|uniref:DUF5683 domain-containing protein n=1 Tax=Saonia flava TaxID=523696 RepID=A0A846R4G7_9FLAO|nr:hypothetical protein [Saonia flava]
MNKSHSLFLLFFLFVAFSWAQDVTPPDQELDSIQTNLKEEGIVVQDSLFTKREEINPLAPSKAAFYSAVLPGLGQIYNKRYWKAPIVWGALGTGVYVYLFNDDSYDRYRTAFKRRRAGFTDDEFYDLNPNDDFIPTEPNVSEEALQDGQERYQRDRDLALLVTIIMYALNVVDANVDAHLKQFNVDDNLSLDMDIKPYLDYNTITASPSYGMALTIKF